MADGHQFGAQYAFRLLDVGPQDRYLDIGCGLAIWALGAHVSSEVQALGVDISGTMVEEARRLSADLPNATFRQGYFPSVLAKETFHRLFSVEALYYLPDLTVALQQVFEHLRADGRFVTVIDYYRENEGCHDWVDRVGVPLVLWSIDEWTNGLSKASFVNISAEQRRHQRRLKRPPGSKCMAVLSSALIARVRHIRSTIGLRCHRCRRWQPSALGGCLCVRILAPGYDPSDGDGLVTVASGSFCPSGVGVLGVAVFVSFGCRVPCSLRLVSLDAALVVDGESSSERPP